MGGLDGQVTAVAFSPDGRMLAAGDQDGTTMLWNMTSEVSSGDVASVRAGGQIKTLSFDMKSGLLATSDASATTTLWNVFAPGAPDPLAVLDASDEARGTAFGPDGNTVVAAGSDGSARIWDIKDPSHPVRGADLALRGEEIADAEFSPDARTVATIAEDDRSVTLSDVARPAQATTLAVAGTKVGNTVATAFSPDGRTLAVVVGRTNLMLWDVANLARPVLLANQGGDFGGVLRFSPDGRALATSGFTGLQITLWNVANRSAVVRLATLLGHSDTVDTMAFSPDGRTLASGGMDHTTVLWDITDRSAPVRLATLNAHARWVDSLAFSPDSRTLATGGGDYAVMLWDISTPAVPIQLARVGTPAGGEPVGLAFRRDGRTLAVTAQAGHDPATVTLWSYDGLNALRAGPAKYACAVTGRGLTATEWARFIPEIKYRKTCA
jgi:WD40 repeat protein